MTVASGRGAEGPPSGDPAVAVPLGGPDAAVVDPVRGRESRRLAHELHDTVTHHLATVALRTMGDLDGAGREELRAVIGDVHSSAGSALVELRRLAHLLGDPPDGSAAAVSGLNRETGPRAAAALWRDRLEEAGLVTELTVPDAADGLARSVRSTVVRTFEAAGHTLLRHATPGSRCRLTVEVGADRVVVRAAATPPPTGLDPEVLAPELRALRERVDLTRGVFGAGVSVSATGTSRWVVTVVLPLD